MTKKIQAKLAKNGEFYLHIFSAEYCMNLNQSSEMCVGIYFNYTCMAFTTMPENTKRSPNGRTTERERRFMAVPFFFSSFFFYFYFFFVCVDFFLTRLMQLLSSTSSSSSSTQEKINNSTQRIEGEKATKEEEGACSEELHITCSLALSLCLCLCLWVCVSVSFVLFVCLCGPWFYSCYYCIICIYIHMYVLQFAITTLEKETLFRLFLIIHINKSNVKLCYVCMYVCSVVLG